MKRNQQLAIGKLINNPFRSFNQFDSGLEMDVFASNVGVGCIVELIGLVTRARICLLEVASLSPLKYHALTKINLRNSSAHVEFSGVLKLRAIGTGTLPDWSLSTPGNANTGGPVFLSTSRFVLDGLKFLNGRNELKVSADIYLHTLFDSTTNNHMYIGYYTDAAPTLIHSSGHGKSATGWANTSQGDQAIDSPVPLFNTNFVTSPDLLTSYELYCVSHSYGVSPSENAQIYGGMSSLVRSGVGGIRTGAHTIIGENQLIPCIGQVGSNGRIHINTISCFGN